MNGFFAGVLGVGFVYPAERFLVVAAVGGVPVRGLRVTCRGGEGFDVGVRVVAVEGVLRDLRPRPVGVLLLPGQTTPVVNVLVSAVELPSDLLRDNVVRQPEVGEIGSPRLRVSTLSVLVVVRSRKWTWCCGSGSGVGWRCGWPRLRLRCR